MSDFRNQFHAAQLNYHRPLYPDDLASLLLPPRRRIWPMIIGTLVAGAAAAIIVIVLLNQVVVPAPQQGSTHKKQPGPELASLPGLPEMPRTAVAPSVGDQPVFLPGLPSFPSLSEVLLGGENPSNTSPKEMARESL